MFHRLKEQTDWALFLRFALGSRIYTHPELFSLRIISAIQKTVHKDQNRGGGNACTESNSWHSQKVKQSMFREQSCGWSFQKQQPEDFLNKCINISMKAAISLRFLTGFQTETQDARAEPIDRAGEWPNWRYQTCYNHDERKNATVTENELKNQQRNRSGEIKR